jgi:hypothetical protein
MKSILNNRKLDNREARLIDFLRWHALLGSSEELLNIIDRAFEAGVAAKSDSDFAERLSHQDLAEMTVVLCQDRPVASMNVKPGGMIAILRREDA